jgi:aminoglycoside 6-adenylyltransferase
MGRRLVDPGSDQQLNEPEPHRFLEEWADPRAVEELRRAYAYYDAAGVRRALDATMALFRRLAMETAERLGLAYPAEVEARATEWMGGVSAG